MQSFLMALSLAGTLGAAKAKEVQIQLNGLESLDEITSMLSTALQKNPTATRFRMNRRHVVFSSGGKGTLLYNRRQHTLTFYTCCYSYHDFGRTHYRWSGVTDAIIQKAAKEHNPVDDFARYGCHRQTLPQ